MEDLRAAILSRLQKLRGPDTKGEHIASCPFHNDHNRPNLSINFDKGCYICRACGSSGNLARLAARLGIEAENHAKAARSPCKRRETHHNVCNATGELVAVHVRRDGQDGDKSMWWERPNGERGLGGVRVEDLPLYGTERLADLPDGATVVVTEGEKAAAALWELGIPAVATVTGANETPGLEALRPLIRLAPVLWADNDEPGRAHMGRIAARLNQLRYEDGI